MPSIPTPHSLSPLLSSPLLMNQQQQQQEAPPPKMSKKGQWEALFVDQDDSLSLSDLPSETLDDANDDNREQFMKSSSEAIEEFEFRTLGGGSLLPKADMCAADQVFYKGHLLPLRLSSVGSQDNARYGQYCNSSSSSSGRTLSSSSRSTSRSQSSSSHSSGCEALPPRASVSNIFYAYPSPRPQAVGRRACGSTGSARRISAGSAPPGWNVFTLGIAKAPEIELSDLRLRRLRASSTADKRKSCGAKEKKNVSPSSMGLGLGLGLGLGFGCKCRPDAVEPIPIKVPKNICSKEERKEEEGRAGKLGLKREESMCRSRMIEWLEELSIGKGLMG